MGLPILGMSDIVNLSFDKEAFNIIHHRPINMPVIEAAHKHDFFMILLITKGSGTHTIDFRPLEVKEKVVFFLSPGQAHEWKMSADTFGWQLMFSNKILLSDGHLWPLFSPRSNSFLELTEAQNAQLLHELQAFKHETSASIIQHRLQIVLHLLQGWHTSAYPGDQHSAKNHILNRFLIQLEEHYTEQHSVGFYADQLHVNASYLTQVCSAMTNQSAGDHIRERLLLEAKRLLALTDTDVKGIAYDLGFKDTSYFSRFFKKYTDLTPVEFREQ